MMDSAAADTSRDYIGGHEPPCIATVRALHAEHLKRHRDLPDEVRYRELQGEKEKVREYSGRVVYELLQNALDRADERILVWYFPGKSGTPGKLLVANDGVPVTAYPREQAEVRDDGTVRLSDFHALLSLHTSSKTAGQSVGNKGIGFRSVFGSSGTVKVWSHSKDGWWWGLEMRHPAEWHRVDQWTAPHVASFYHPVFADTQDFDSALGQQLVMPCDPGALAGLVTLICLPEIPADIDRGEDDVLQSIEALASLPLRFLSERARTNHLKIELRVGDEQPQFGHLTLPAEWIELNAGELTLDAAARSATGLDLQVAKVKLLLPPENTPTGSTLFWSYLPTEEPAGHGVHVQGDFYLTSSRRAVVFGKPGGARPQDHNARLLGIAAAGLVEKMWRNPQVTSRNDFWRLVHPSSCANGDMRHAVAERILLNPDRLVELVRDGFSNPPVEASWTRQRYADFFETLEAWAVYAYHQGWDSGQGKAQYQWRKALRTLVETSGAAVLPILDSTDDSDICVEKALPMVVRERGRQKEYQHTIYSRLSVGVQLPDAVRKQGTWTTTFRPPYMNQSTPGEYGLIEFNRVEILAHLRPINTPDVSGCEELLRTAFEIALEESETGGVGSVWSKIRSLGLGPAWTLLVAQETLSNAGRALRELHVPTLDGEWLSASSVSDPPETVAGDDAQLTGWPWPVVDRARIADLLKDKELIDTAPEDMLCELLGVGSVPLVQDSGEIAIVDWPAVLETSKASPAAISACICKGWARTFSPIFQTHRENPDGKTKGIVESLRQSCWITTATGEDLSVTLKHPEHDERSVFAPDDLWLRNIGQGYQAIGLLPHLLIEKDALPPVWVHDLGITRVDERGPHQRRIERALQFLSTAPVDLVSRDRELEDLYARLIRTYAELQFTPQRPQDIPVLVRHHGAAARRGKLRWHRGDGRVWYDSGDHSYLLRAFSDFRLWTVRRTSAELGKSLGIVTFKPIVEHRQQKKLDTDLPKMLRAAVTRCLPDILAVLQSIGTTAIDLSLIVRRFCSINFSHWDDVWSDCKFDEHTGHIGQGEDNGVVLLECPGGCEIAFDGSDLSIIMQEAAEPVALALIPEDRRCVPVFESVLRAWSGAIESQFSDQPQEVGKLRSRWSVADDEVDEWRRRIDSMLLNSDELQEWSMTLQSALSRYGDVADLTGTIAMSIRPDSWRKPTTDVTAQRLHTQLLEAFKNCSERVRPTCPAVVFLSFHENVFDDLCTREANRIIADCFYGIPEAEWSERRLEYMRMQLGVAVTDEERCSMHKLLCDTVRLAYARVQGKTVPEEQRSSALWKRAYAFVRGDLRLKFVPLDDEAHSDATHSVQVVDWSTDMHGPVMRDAADEDHYIQEQRRKARAGATAEMAVLRAVSEDARQWLESDSAGFYSSVSAALVEHFPDREAAVSQFIQEMRESIGCASGQNMNLKIQSALHISKRWGDAGFDVVVPRRGKVVLVEVKRIAAPRAAVFYLSENERVQALRAKMHGRWRLWLIDNSGTPYDISSAVINTLEKNAARISELRKDGMRPGDYALSVRFVGTNNEC